jgi:hypothetical protein
VSEIFEDDFRVTVRVEDFREMIHTLEYCSTDKDYVLRFPIHAMKGFEVIPKMKDLLDRVEKAIAIKKMEQEKIKKEYDVSEYKEGDFRDDERRKKGY